MKKRVLSLLLALTLCLTLLPTAAFAESTTGGGVYVPPGSPTEGGGGTYVPGEDTRTEIWCVSKPDSIGRGYDGTTDGSTIPITLTFTDGTNTFELEEGTGFTAKKTFDSADAGWHTVTVEITLIGETANKYKLKDGEEKFTIGGNINKAYPHLTVFLSKTTCAVGEKLLPLLSVEGVPEDAAVTYYYTPYKTGYLEFEDSEAVPKIDENTAISETGTYYVYAKTGETQNYEEKRSTTVELTVREAATDAASVTRADGTERGTYASLPAALNAAADGDTVKLLADHVTNWNALNDFGDDFKFEDYASIVPVVTKTLTLELNSKTVDYLEVGFSETDEETQEKEILKTGDLTVTSKSPYGIIIDLMFMGGILDIRGGQIGILVNDNGVESPDRGLVCDVNSGTATISNGMVYGLTVLEGAAVTVKNGFNHRGRWSVDSGGTLSITGGTFKDVRFVNSGTIAISGGTFEKISNNDTNTPQPLMLLLAKDCAFVNEDITSDVQDGTKTSLTEVMVKKHTHTFENGKCACGVKAIVTDNNVNYYSTLQAALDAAANDNTITTVTLQQDLADEEVKFRRAAAGALTLNMNGHKLEATAGVPLTVIGGELIIEGAGEISQNTDYLAAPLPAISLTGGKLVIKGDLTAQGGYDSRDGRKPAIYATDGELDLQGNVSLNGGLTITGTAKLTNLLTQGTFYVDASETGNAIAITDSEVPGGEVYKKALELLAKDYAFYRADGSLADAGGAKLKTGTYTIKSHTCSYTHDETNGIAYCNCGRSHAHRDLSDDKSVLVNGVCPICGYHCPHKNVDETTLSCSDCGAKVVAKVEVEGSEPTYAFDLASAFQNAVNGTTITMLADVDNDDEIRFNIDEPEKTGETSTVTLNLDGHNIRVQSLSIGQSNREADAFAKLTVTGKGNLYAHGSITVCATGTLDLTDWTGGQTHNIAVEKAFDAEGTLIVGENAGDIVGDLYFRDWPSGTAKVSNTKLRGGTYNSISMPSGGSVGDLLEAGYAFQYMNSDAYADTAASSIKEVKVVSCDHGGANGFDLLSATCPSCGAAAVASASLKDIEDSNPWRNFADLQIALGVKRNAGTSIKLLADLSGDYTIDGTQSTGLDLNSHSINGTLDIKAVAEGKNYTTTLSNSGSTGSIKTVVAHRGANLAGSGTPALIGTLEIADTSMWQNLLKQSDRVGFKARNEDGTHKWYAASECTEAALYNVTIESLPITSKNLSFKVNGENVTGNKVECGTTVQLCAYCNTSDADVYIYTGVPAGDGTFTYSQRKAEYKKIGNMWYYVVDFEANTIGTYSVYFTASKDGYSVTSTPKTLTVTKLDLSKAEITFRSSNESTYEPYNSTTTAPGFTVTYNGKTLKLGVDYTASGTASSAGVSTQTLTIKAVEGSDYTGSKTAEWRIVPHKAKVEVGDVIKAYDGTTDLPDGKISLVSAAGSAGYQAGLPLPLSEGNGFELTDAKYDSADASETEKNISFTIKLTDRNYTFEDGTTQKDFVLNGAEVSQTFKINQATVTPPAEITQLVFNDLEKTYEIDLKTLLPELPIGREYGKIEYQGRDFRFTDSTYLDFNNLMSVSREGILTLPIVSAHTADVNKQIGTITVPVVTTNYQRFEFTIKVFIGEKIPLDQSGVSVSATNITYGQTLADSTLTATGSMICPRTQAVIPGTFAWTNKDLKPDASDSYEAEWTFTPAEGYEEYAPATGTVKVKVNRKSIEGATVALESDSFEYDGNNKTLDVKSVVLDGVILTPTTDYGYYCDMASDVGTHKLTVSGNNNYTGEVTVKWSITAREVTPTIEVASCSYTGDALEPDVTLKDDLGNIIASKEYTVSYSNNTNAGDAQVTIKDVDGGNYVIKGTSQTFTIGQADAPTNIQTGTLNVINGMTLTYTYDFSQLLPKLTTGEYGAIAYRSLNVRLESEYSFDTARVDEATGALTLKLISIYSPLKPGASAGTVSVYVHSTNFKPFLLELSLNPIDQIKPVVDTISATEITYGDELNKSTISGKMKDPETDEEVTGTFTWKNGETKPNAGMPDAEWVFTPDESYNGVYATVAGKVTVKVNKVTIPEGTVTVKQKGTLTYTGQPLTAQVEITGVEGLEGIKFLYATSPAAGHDEEVPAFTNADTYTVYYQAESTNYDIPAGTFTVTIDPLKLNSVSFVSSLSKVYDGSASITLSDAQKAAITFHTTSDTSVTLPTDAFTIKDAYFVKDDTSRVPSPEAGSKGGIYFTVTLNSNNYRLVDAYKEELESLEASCSPVEGNPFTITQATVNSKQIEQYVYNDLARTYEIDLEKYLPELSRPCDYGDISYTYDPITVTFFADYYDKDSATMENGILRLPIKKASTASRGDTVVTLTVQVISTNYAPFDLHVGAIVKDKIEPDRLSIAVTATDITYGDALEKSTLEVKGTMKDPATGAEVKGTFSWTDKTIKPNAGSYDAEWTFTPSDAEIYAEVTGTVTIKVNKATPTGAPQYTKITTGGKTLKEAALTTEGSTLKPDDGKLEWVDAKGNVLPDDTRVEANTTYTWRFTPTNTNYTTLTGEIELYHKSSSGSTTAPVITVPVSSDKETVKVDASVSNGVAAIKVTDRQLEQVATNTDTVTVDVSGLKNVDSAKLPASIVEKSGQSGAELTIALPTGSVTLDAAALAAVGNGKDVTISVQKTVLTDAQRDAVGTLAQVAVVVDVNVLTGATKCSSFNGGKLTVSIPYTLKADEDPAKLQVWFIRDDGSIENMGGSYDRKTGCFVFSTEHLSCYLLVSTASTQRFVDVPASAYYADAVAWAVKNGITGGTSATTFSPDGFCTRAQAVTFLWRAAGSPAPKSTAMPFTDVPAGSYYYDAVLWAIENGVTKGTSNTTFSPNENCSRGQIVTFLWRSQKSPDAAAANPFTDVAVDAYYTSAVLWAVEKSITGGTSTTTFSPSANCTRAQIVTFLHRMYQGN